MRPTRRFASIAAIVTATAGLLAGSGFVATAGNAMVGRSQPNPRLNLTRGVIGCP